jgi:hypothetical protein
MLKPGSEWREGMTWDRLIGEMDGTMRFPGMPNIWWMPIQTRTESMPGRFHIANASHSKNTSAEATWATRARRPEQSAGGFAGFL